jgi:hypothetical protein
MLVLQRLKSMKKIWVIGFLVGICSLANATQIQINAPSGLIGTNALNGSDAYEWGLSLGSGTKVTSAEIDFTSIELTASGNSQGTGVLYCDLLKATQTGLASVSDGDAAGDYWSTVFSGANITKLSTNSFASVGTTLTWSIILNSSQLTALNSYLAANAGVFNIGIDPDCHFSVGGLDFKYTTPDVATTVFLLAASLLGLEMLRRRLVLAKARSSSS